MPRPSRLSLELLETFVALAEFDGDASRAAAQLGVNQPSVSKRLAAIRRLTGKRTGQAWLARQGKRWRLTPEGQRVRVVVADMVHRYEQLERFLASGVEVQPLVAVACGQQAASGFVRVAVQLLMREDPRCRVRVSTPRGRARIEGVAGGQFDLAVVTDSPTTIRQVARREMYVERLMEDHFVLAADPPAKSPWGQRWRGLRPERFLAAADLLDLPFILPEPDSSRRAQLDGWCYQATGKMLHAVLEVGGWQTILEFVASGLGVGLVPQSAVDAFRERHRGQVAVRPLDPAQFPPDAVRLIARKAHGKAEPDVTAPGVQLLAALRRAVPAAGRVIDCLAGPEKV